MLPPRQPLPRIAWTTPFALFLVVVPVEVLVLVYLQLAGSLAVAGDFLRWQWFVDVWTASGTLERGLPFELMKINVLFVVYFWLMTRTMHPRREAVQRLALLGAALVMLALHLLLARSADLVRPRFELLPIPG